MTHYVPITIIDRMSEVLDMLEKCPRGIKPADILKRKGIPKTTVYRLLSSMEQNGYLAFHADTNSYTLGSRFFATYASLDERCQRLRKIALPYLHKLADFSQETVKLNLLSGAQSYTADIVEGARPIRVSVNPGAVFPLHAGAGGKVLMCNFTRSDINLYYKLYGVRYTDATIVEPEAMIKELERVRELGYAMDVGEYLTEIHAIACPIKDAARQIIASISIAYPTSTEGRLDISDLVQQVKLAADAISNELGAINHREAPARLVVEQTNT